jgi:hypothetical protein
MHMPESPAPDSLAPPAGRPFLIAAHPGHELQLYHWMECHRPLVFLLTDGSGGDGEARTAFSDKCCRDAGAEPGEVFGAMSDRAWYIQVLAGDAQDFLAAAASIVAAGARRPPSLVVSDAVEGYNPMHDLCAAVGARVASALGVPHLTQAVTGGACGQVNQRLELDAAARTRKREAALAYAPLAGEVRPLLDAGAEQWACEQLLTQGFGWPDSCDAAYERTGRERVATGRYGAVITYRHHVLKIARRLLRPD